MTDVIWQKRGRRTYAPFLCIDSLTIHEARIGTAFRKREEKLAKVSMGNPSLGFSSDKLHSLLIIFILSFMGCPFVPSLLYFGVGELKTLNGKDDRRKAKC